LDVAVSDRGPNDVFEGTKLPRLKAEEVEAMTHRDSLAILGLGTT
jgi:hypothetical protein